MSIRVLLLVMGSVVRCFLAIELSDAARDHLVRLQDAVRGEIPGASYARAGNLHVTLKFLGEGDDRGLATLCESMRMIRVSGRVELAAARLDAFPPRGPARIVVATLAGSEGVVTALHDAIEQRCRKLGFEAEHRRYHPHVTLARSKSGVPRAQLERVGDSISRLWPGPTFPVSEFVLFQSQLHPQGARHIKLASFSTSG